jgi:hypothetical protein
MNVYIAHATGRFAMNDTYLGVGAGIVGFVVFCFVMWALAERCCGMQITTCCFNPFNLLRCPVFSQSTPTQNTARYSQVLFFERGQI